LRMHERAPWESRNVYNRDRNTIKTRHINIAFSQNKSYKMGRR
jgi:hypothetical protein